MIIDTPEFSNQMLNESNQMLSKKLQSSNGKTIKAISVRSSQVVTTLDTNCSGIAISIRSPSCRMG